MTTTLKTFNLAPSLSLRAIEIDGEPWFIATDVCHVLGMSTDKGVGKWLNGLDPDEKQKVRIAGGIRGNPDKVCISESGLYSLIMKSRKPEAVDFQNWVTQEVLPAIRRNGAYMTPKVAQLAEDDPALFMEKALVMANDTIRRLRVTSGGVSSATSKVAQSEHDPIAGLTA